ncbi:hypothetical protein HCCG_00494 [Helicobacter cinaedi CCUG 18818 = ATCC BAA-847]|uniref:Uncharacterized protein n=1 Tax=Helicobacter cinaedi CCUG 18818 = ATCC BAA-847 TaxID=537971 RepID=A0ABN0BB47_9HELI|nr:hypothetical protein HCCG_00494 [Helicobacter cinaedi CCUG 18818 = ATCC BAA-847]
MAYKTRRIRRKSRILTFYKSNEISLRFANLALSKFFLGKIRTFCIITLF